MKDSVCFSWIYSLVAVVSFCLLKDSSEAFYGQRQRLNGESLCASRLDTRNQSNNKMWKADDYATREIWDVVHRQQDKRPSNVCVCGVYWPPPQSIRHSFAAVNAIGTHKTDCFMRSLVNFPRLQFWKTKTQLKKNDSVCYRRDFKRKYSCAIGDGQRAACSVQRRNKQFHSEFGAVCAKPSRYWMHLAECRRRMSALWI